MDALLDDPVFFAPFVPFFDPRVGRPSTPIETYLRMMFLKFRYRLGYESLCREVTDSITWRRFCRIPIDGRVPHPTTLMKLTTRCGTAAVDGLQRGAAGEGGGGQAAAHGPAARGHHGGAGRCGLPDGFRVAGQGGSADHGDWPADPGRGRSDPHPGAEPEPGGREAGAWDRREAALAGRAGPGGDARRALRRAQVKAAALAAAGGRDAAAGRRRGRLRRAVKDLTDLLDATRRIAGQTRQRLTGLVPDGATRLVSLHERDARPIAKGRLGKPVKFGYKAQVIDNDDGVVLDSTLQQGNPPDAPQLGPAVKRVIRRTGRRPWTVTADRGYGEARVEDNLHDMGVPNVVIPRKGKPGNARQAREHRRAFRRTVKWRTGSEGRISSLKRGYGWDRARIDGTEGARIWTGQAVLAHNLVKIGALAG